MKHNNNNNNTLTIVIISLLLCLSFCSGLGDGDSNGNGNGDGGACVGDHCTRTTTTTTTTIDDATKPIDESTVIIDHVVPKGPPRNIAIIGGGIAGRYLLINLFTYNLQKNIIISFCKSLLTNTNFM